MASCRTAIARRERPVYIIRRQHAYQMSTFTSNPENKEKNHRLVVRSKPDIEEKIIKSI